MPEIEPYSQMLGALAAQITAVSEKITDLRSEVITNRTNTQTWRDEIGREIELVHAEYRTIKHDERTFAAEKVALDRRLEKLEDRVAEVERILLVWKTKIGMVISASIVIGVVIERGLGYALWKIWP